MRFSRSDWLVPLLLVLLGVVPAIGGLARVVDLTSGAPPTPDNARFHAAPIPMLLHIASVLPFSLLGALQFSSALRRARRRWHVVAGRLLAPSGIVVALTGLWMAQTYPWPPTDNRAVYLERVVFGTAMLVSLLIALDAIRRRNLRAHGAWMTRAYAIGMGAGTQVFTHVPWFVATDVAPAGVPRAVMMGAGWVINLLVAEFIIRRRDSRENSRLVQSPVHRRDDASSAYPLSEVRRKTYPSP